MKCICPNCKTEFDPAEIQLSQKRREQLISVIREMCARHFAVSLIDMVDRSRKREYVVCRHVAMYFLSEYTDMSLKKIGLMFGGRDHTTVINAKKRCKNALFTKQDVYEDIILLRHTIVDISNSIKEAA